VALIELVRRRAKVLGESFDGLDVVLNRGFGVVASLEFLQHRLSEMGHRNLLVTHTLPGWPSVAHAERPPRQRLRSNAAGLPTSPASDGTSLGDWSLAIPGRRGADERIKRRVRADLESRAFQSRRPFFRPRFHDAWHPSVPDGVDGRAPAQDNADVTEVTALRARNGLMFPGGLIATAAMAGSLACGSEAPSRSSAHAAASPTSPAAFSIEEATIDGIHAALLSGETTCHAIVQAYIDRARAYNGVCTSLVTADGADIPPAMGAVRAGAPVLRQNRRGAIFGHDRECLKS
jgi:hypothetical protein